MTLAYFYLRRTAARICRQTSTELRIKVYFVEFDNVPRPTLGCVESIDLVLLQATLLVEPLHADSPSRQPAFLGITRVDLGCPVQNVIGDNRRLSHNAVDYSMP